MSLEGGSSWAKQGVNSTFSAYFLFKCSPCHSYNRDRSPPSLPRDIKGCLCGFQLFCRVIQSGAHNRCSLDKAGKSCRPQIQEPGQGASFGEAVGFWLASSSSSSLSRWSSSSVWTPWGYVEGGPTVFSLPPAKWDFTHLVLKLQGAPVFVRGKSPLFFGLGGA